MKPYTFQPLTQTSTSEDSRLRFEQIEKIPLNIDFSIGSLKISAQEASYFSPSTLLPLHTTEDIPVRIHVGGQTLGTGKIVFDKDGNIFVKIIENKKE